MKFKFINYLSILLWSINYMSSLYCYNSQHLDSLLSQLKEGNVVNCVGFDLADADLSGLNLEAAIFSKANLKGANFIKSNLSGALFIEAQLQRTNLSHSNLSQADFTHANMNGANFRCARLQGANLSHTSCKGARFKGAQLLGANYEKIYSSTGSLFSDVENAIYNLEKEKIIEDIKLEFLNDESAFVYRFGKKSSLSLIYQILFKELSKASKKTGIEYIVADFRLMFENDSQRFRSCCIVKEMSIYLRASLFQPFVRRVVPICDDTVLIIFLNEPAIIWEKRKDIACNERFALDLHGKSPIEMKYKLIDNFIKESYLKSRSSVEIITGRGLHNPKGKMGILHRLCKNHLMNDQLKYYVKKIESINNNGGWRVILKNYSCNKN